jgi:hypothetical protein
MIDKLRYSAVCRIECIVFAMMCRMLDLMRNTASNFFPPYQLMMYSSQSTGGRAAITTV